METNPIFYLCPKCFETFEIGAVKSSARGAAHRYDPHGCRFAQASHGQAGQSPVERASLVSGSDRDDLAPPPSLWRIGCLALTYLPAKGG